MTKDEAVDVLDDFALYLDRYIVQPAVAEIKAASKAASKESGWHLSGEFLRDAAVLIIVFVPLDYFVSRSAVQHDLLPTKIWAGIAALSFVLLLIGIRLSTRGRE